MESAEQQLNFRVYWRGTYPGKKRQFAPGDFAKRQQARQFCRNHSWYAGLTIVHPDGTEEPFVPAAASG